MAHGCDLQSRWNLPSLLLLPSLSVAPVSPRAAQPQVVLVGGLPDGHVALGRRIDGEVSLRTERGPGLPGVKRLMGCPVSRPQDTRQGGGGGGGQDSLGGAIDPEVSLRSPRTDRCGAVR